MKYSDIVSYINENGDKSIFDLNKTQECWLIPLHRDKNTNYSEISSIEQGNDIKNKALLADLLSNGYFVVTIETATFVLEEFTGSYENSYFVIDLMEERSVENEIKEILKKRNISEFLSFPKGSFMKSANPELIKDGICIEIDTQVWLFNFERIEKIHILPGSGFGHLAMHRYAIKH
jgi:hypothetical protein